MLMIPHSDIHAAPEERHILLSRPHIPLFSSFGQRRSISTGIPRGGRCVEFFGSLPERGIGLALQTPGHEDIESSFG
jgi:hypothetical protein